MRIVLPVAGLLAAAQLLCLPFSVSVWPQPGAAWTVFGRLDFAGSRFPVTSANAFNLWAIIAGIDKSDLAKGWLGVSLRDWSLAMFAAFAALATFVAWLRARDTAVVLWSCAAVACAFFVLPTRIHERYLFIAIPLLAVSAAYSRWLIPHFVVATGLYFFNVWYEYATLRASGGEPLTIDLSWLILPASFVGVFLFVGCLVALVAFGFMRKARMLEDGTTDGGREPQRVTSAS